MRKYERSGPLSVHAIAGAYVVLLGIDMDELGSAGVLHFAIERIEHGHGNRRAWGRPSTGLVNLFDPNRRQSAIRSRLTWLRLDPTNINGCKAIHGAHRTLRRTHRLISARLQNGLFSTNLGVGDRATRVGL